MNCEDFDHIINEIADFKPMQATIRDAGVSHAALCHGCAEKLASARAVGGWLIQAARAESEEAPNRVKENLLAAFEDRKLNHFATADLSAPVVDIASRRRRSWTVAALAAAAVILLALIVPIWRRMSEQGPPIQLLAQQAAVPESEVVIGKPATTSPVIDPLPSKKLRASEGQGTRRARPVGQRTTETARVKQTNEETAKSVGEYLPLTYLSKETAMESGTVVRVELSRSALASLGFPVSVDGSGSSVKAEVILGDDGVARAIRLVQ